MKTHRKHDTAARPRPHATWFMVNMDVRISPHAGRVRSPMALHDALMRAVAAAGCESRGSLILPRSGHPLDAVHDGVMSLRQRARRRGVPIDALARRFGIR